MKVEIDREECIFCGACWEECPEVFEEGEAEGLSPDQVAQRRKQLDRTYLAEAKADLPDMSIPRLTNSSLAPRRG